MSSTDKFEVMDLLINVLKDHEKNLDTLITRAENVVEENQSPQKMMQNSPPLKIILHDWVEFKDHALEAELICFDIIDSMFLCEALTMNKVYSYREPIPKIDVEMRSDQNLVLSGFDHVSMEKGTSVLNGQLMIGLELRTSGRKKSGSGVKHEIHHKLDPVHTKKMDVP